MDKSKKKAAISADINALRLSGILLNDRQYIDFAKKVMAAAFAMPPRLMVLQLIILAIWI